MIPVFNPDSVYIICELFMNPIELKSLKSFEQKITGLNQIGEYRLTIRYSLKGKSETYILMADYKVTH